MRNAQRVSAIMNTLSAANPPTVDLPPKLGHKSREEPGINAMTPLMAVVGFASKNISTAQFILDAYRRQASPGHPSARPNDSLLQASNEHQESPQ
jgi:hypothetical protein